MLQCPNIFDEDDVLSSVLQGLGVLCPDHIDEYSRSMLQKYHDKLYLWNAYALVKFRVGMFDEVSSCP